MQIVYINADVLEINTVEMNIQYALYNTIVLSI